jgi:hypothetical protein
VIHIGKVRNKATPAKAHAARNRQCHEQFDGAALLFFRPQSHRDRGDQKEIEPRMKAKEDVEFGTSGFVELTEIERERSHRQQKDNDENIG